MGNDATISDDDSPSDLKKGLERTVEEIGSAITKDESHDNSNVDSTTNKSDLPKALSDSFVELTAVSRVYKTKYSSADDVIALNNVELKMEPGERIALLGKSGSGKSTLLNLLGGLDQPTSGSIIVNQQEVTSLDSQEMAIYRQRSVGMIFQAFNLIPTKTALKNVELPFVFAGVSQSVRKKKAKEALESVGLGKRIKHRPAQLSGGEQQRVAIARAIASKPGLLLADEPTGNLDSATAREIMQQLVAFSDKNKTAIILVTHDEELAHEFAHRIVRLADGVIVESA